MTSPELILAAEADRLLIENPSWPYKKIINKVKEMMEDEKISEVEKVNKGSIF